MAWEISASVTAFHIPFRFPFESASDTVTQKNLTSVRKTCTLCLIRGADCTPEKGT